jgi:hypothetical protein
LTNQWIHTLIANLNEFFFFIIISLRLQGLIMQMPDIEKKQQNRYDVQKSVHKSFAIFHHPVANATTTVAAATASIVCFGAIKKVCLFYLIFLRAHNIRLET